MIDAKIIEDLSKKLSTLVPEGARELGSEVEKNFRAALGSAFSKLELVTREELDVQKSVLARTREKIEALEARVHELETALREERERAGGNNAG
ncbi:MAG: accessory factor UbiK family protein [Chromatiales bacterium]|jgi:BMFP domain-containing protein YqiC|nr:accessory factor UbiK family protein [Chromatiales bacterium]